MNQLYLQKANLEEENQDQGIINLHKKKLKIQLLQVKKVQLKKVKNLELIVLLDVEKHLKKKRNQKNQIHGQFLGKE